MQQQQQKIVKQAIKNQQINNTEFILCQRKKMASSNDMSPVEHDFVFVSEPGASGSGSRRKKKSTNKMQKIQMKMKPKLIIGKKMIHLNIHMDV